MKDKKPQGIGGWLILPTIGLFIGAVIWSFSFFIWGAALLVGEISPFSLVMFLSSLVMAPLLIVAIVFEFKKKKIFPKIIISSFWVGVFSSFILTMIDGDGVGLMKDVLTAILWTVYFNVSVRVKNTFVN